MGNGKRTCCPQRSALGDKDLLPFSQMGITRRRRLAILLAYSLQGCSGFASYPSYQSLFISGNNSFKQLCNSPKPATRDGGRRRTLICLLNHESSTTERTKPMPFRTSNSRQRSIAKTIQLVTVSFLTAVTLIAWEDLSNVHPMRSYLSSSQPYFGSTVRGLAFGSNERQMVPSDVESASMQTIPSYNEVMLRHRTRRVPTWKTAVTHQDVATATRTLQLALLHIIKCQHLSNDYGWEELSAALREPIVTTQLDEACDVLNRASEYLSLEARSEIGFDFGSCAWRHCGAFADVREAIDELDHLVGVLGRSTVFK